MATLYDIDLLRALLVNRINDESVFLASFYEQIKGEEAIARYVDELKELIALQNQEKSKSNYKALGIVSQSGNANIVNIKQNYILPFDFQVRFDIELTDRDYVLDKIKDMILATKGRKYDLALQDDGGVLVFGEPNTFNDLHSLPIAFNNAYFVYSGGDPTSGTNYRTQFKNNFLLTKNTQNLDLTTYYIYNNAFYKTIYKHTGWTTVVSNITAYNATTEQKEVTILQSQGVTNARIAEFLNDTDRTHRGVLRLNILDDEFVLISETYYSISLGTESTNLTTLGVVPQFYKLSLSFNTIQSQEPYITNGLDRVFLFFGGSVTIADGNVGMGNDIVRFTIQEGKDTGTIYVVEPTEIPSSLAVTDDSFQTWNTGYRTTDRNMTIDNKINYAFVYDRNNTLYNYLYQYARFGGGITNPNTIYTIREYRYAFGVLNIDKFYAKLGEVQFSNTNGDVMTLSVAFKAGAY
jgi:hypothetical protein